MHELRHRHSLSLILLDVQMYSTSNCLAWRIRMVSPFVYLYPAKYRQGCRLARDRALVLGQWYSMSFRMLGYRQLSQTCTGKVDMWPFHSSTKRCIGSESIRAFSSVLRLTCSRHASCYRYRKSMVCLGSNELVDITRIVVSTQNVDIYIDVTNHLNINAD